MTAVGGAGPGHTASAPHTPPMRVWLGATLTVGVVAAAGLQQGAFFPGDAAIVALASLGVLTVELLLHRVDRSTALVVAAICALCAWWLVRAVSIHSAGSFLPFGASLLGFAAAFAAIRPLSPRHREVTTLALAALGTCEALAGFVGMTFRWAPLAIPSQMLWRLSGSLTYANAAGLVLAVIALASLGSNERSVVTRLAVCLCLAGAIASQSRGAGVALVGGAFFVPLDRYRALWLPLSLGALTGAVAVGTSPSSGSVPLLACTVGVAAVASACVRARPIPAVSTRSARARIGVIVAVGAGTTLLLHHVLALRTLSPAALFDRDPEWLAAAHQFTLSPYVGVGPDQIMPFVNNSGYFTHFAHNEYLQVAAGAGVVGLALLAVVALAVARGVRRADVATSCATGALVAFAVGGAFDYDWHLPAIAMVGGVVAALASTRRPADEDDGPLDDAVRGPDPTRVDRRGHPA